MDAQAVSRWNSPFVGLTEPVTMPMRSPITRISPLQLIGRTIHKVDYNVVTDFLSATVTTLSAPMDFATGMAIQQTEVFSGIISGLTEVLAKALARPASMPRVGRRPDEWDWNSSAREISDLDELTHMLNLSSKELFALWALPEGDFKDMMLELYRIYHSPQEYSLGDIPVTRYAFDTTWQLLFGASESVTPFPFGDLTWDEDDGSIAIYWRKPERKVHLVVPADKTGQSYIYHREGMEHRLEPHITTELLIKWLDWFNKTEEGA